MGDFTDRDISDIVKIEERIWDLNKTLLKTNQCLSSIAHSLENLTSFVTRTSVDSKVNSGNPNKSPILGYDKPGWKD